MPDPETPDDPVAWFTAARDYGYEQDYPNALRCYEKATQLNPDFIDAWGRMGLLLVKLGRFDEAHVCDARIRELNMRFANENRRLSESVWSSHPFIPQPLPEEPLINPWIAGAASAICPGWGQVYTGGDYGKGWLVFAELFFFALVGGVLDSFKGTHALSPLAPLQAALPRLAFLLPALVWIYSIIEAGWSAHAINKHQEIFVVVRAGKLLAYLVITSVIAALLFLYFPMMVSVVSGFIAKFGSLL